MLAIRREALRVYGGDPPRCAWCGCEDRDRLEIDHIQGDGNVERRSLTRRLEYDLKRRGWPMGYQLLCRHCHDLKSGRIPAMPPRKGTEDVHISLPTDLLERLTVLASAPGMTRSKVMEAALRQLLEQGPGESLVAGFQQQVSTLTLTLTQALERLQTCVTAMDQRLMTLEQRFHAQVEDHQSFMRAVARLYQAEKAERNGEGKRSWFAR